MHVCGDEFLGVVVDSCESCDFWHLRLVAYRNVIFRYSVRSRLLTLLNADEL